MSVVEAPSPLPIRATPTPLPWATPAISGATAEVCFQRGGEIWGLRIPSHETQVVASGLQATSAFDLGDPWALAPDGQQLALVRNAAGEATLALATLRDGSCQEVGRYEGRIDDLRWSHDSTRVAFVVNRRDERTGDLLEDSLRLYNLTGRREAVLYQQTFAGPDTVSEELWLEGWAPGDEALYVALAMDRTGDPGMLYSIDARGGELWLVSSKHSLKGGQAVSAAASRVLLRARLSAGRASPLYVAQAGRDGSLGEVQLLSPDDWTVGAVAWSPDGRQVAVERLEAQAHGTFAVHLWLLELGGGAPRQLTGDPSFREEQPVWSPDGREIVFGRWLAARPEPAGLWTLRLPDGEPTLVDETGVRPQAVVGGGL